MIKQIYISFVLAIFLRLSLADSINPSSVTSSCPCNQVQGVKEYECCCDTDTIPNITPSVCIEKNYGNVFSIPLYSDLKLKTSSIEDLYNPFRLAYQVIKTLGSVMDRNSVQSTISFSLPSPSDTKDFKQILIDQLNQQTYQALPSYLQPEQRVINKFNFATNSSFSAVSTSSNALYFNMFVKDEVTGNCIQYMATTYETVKYQSCKIRDTSNNFYKNMGSSLTQNDLCYDLTNVFELTSQTPSACVTTSTTTVIGFVNSNTATKGIIYIRYPGSTSPNVFLGAKFYYDYANRSGTTPKPKSGYQIGDPLAFYISGNVQKGLPFNDIFNTRGVCYQTGSTYNMLHPIDLQFGRNLTISCSGQLNTRTMLTTITQIGKFSNPDPRAPFDWVPIQISVTTGFNIAIQVYYFKQGKDTNPTYRITNAQFKQVPKINQSDNGVVSILFYQQPQSPNFFIAAPPQLTAKLPRNILYPFFTFND
ncbi:hypothetical protein TTHERM_00339670 (macronuclear) [Tetrahymena thermophila SB210]|uniref:Tectonic domain-containing protein n=1 Tax=Tetrahymena thermophila (strain SB210) TaxID=312017 RepID=I7M1R1_TETTS|nr:hypothetical protein TTHERM_00339670 [Tetrahymena thermophila SB210]EAR97386.2 hypothetical protein TTHERM_00339670 [Tetrahymena thermophila SB210]|eukprot:XP_001017631.2 hypothetical protein TTHERM_00339670 [Tetrahymena thermophila SB210]